MQAVDLLGHAVHEGPRPRLAVPAPVDPFGVAKPSTAGFRPPTSQTDGPHQLHRIFCSPHYHAAMMTTQYCELATGSAFSHNPPLLASTLSVPVSLKSENRAEKCELGAKASLKNSSLEHFESSTLYDCFLVAAATYYNHPTLCCASVWEGKKGLRGLAGRGVPVHDHLLDALAGNLRVYWPCGLRGFA